MTATLTSTTVDRGRAVATIVAAFAADPIVRWVMPDAARYLATFPETVQLMAGQAFAAGTADVSDDHAGAALWLAPDLAPDERGLVELTQRAVEPERLGDVFALLEQAGDAHPDEPCWYLPFIGVDPAGQGRVSAPRCCAVGWTAATATTCPPTSRRARRAIGPCTSCTDSR